MATETVSVTQMRPRLAELLARAHERFDRFVITRRGRAEAVLLSADEFEGLLETLEILSDKALVKRLVEADDELARGAGHSLDDVRRELGGGRG
jgi:prevent-host-death family protein